MVRVDTAAPDYLALARNVYLCLGRAKRSEPTAIVGLGLLKGPVVVVVTCPEAGRSSGTTGSPLSLKHREVVTDREIDYRPQDRTGVPARLRRRIKADLVRRLLHICYPSRSSRPMRPAGRISMQAPQVVPDGQTR
jgi:hypothetical protein